MVLVYTIIIVILSAYLTNKNKKQASSKFMVAEKDLGLLLLTILLFSESIGGGTTVGVVQSGYMTGVSSIWALWGPAIGYIVAMFATLPFFMAMNKKYGTVSIAETFQHMFDHRCRILMFAVVAFSYTMYTSTQAISASSIIAPLLKLDSDIVAWGITVIFVISALCGMKGVAVIGILHAFFIVIGMGIVAVLGLNSVGGIQSLADTLPKSYFSLAQPSTASMLANIIGAVVSSIIGAQYANACFSAKNTRIAKRALYAVSVIFIVFALFPVTIGLCAKVLLPDVPSAQALYALAETYGPVVSGLAMIGVLAAIMSTAPGFILLIATTISRDFYKLVRPNASDKQLSICTKAAVVFIGFFSTFLGLHSGSILSVTYGAMQIRSVAGIVLLIAMAWPRVNSDAAFWSLATGGLTAIIWFYLGNPHGISALWPGLIVALLVLIPITVFSKEPVSAGYRRYSQALSEYKTGDANE